MVRSVTVLRVAVFEDTRSLPAPSHPRLPGVFQDLRAHASIIGEMPVTIQIRHVPEDVHRKLKARAALERLSLSAFLRREIQLLAEPTTLAEMQARLAQRTPVRIRGSAAKMVRNERNAR